MTALAATIPADVGRGFVLLNFVLLLVVATLLLMILLRIKP